jgi:hypothetical protein
MTPGRVGALIVALLTLAGLAVLVRESTGGPATRVVVAPTPTVAAPPTAAAVGSPAATVAGAPATTAVDRRPAPAPARTAPAPAPVATVAPGPVVAPPPGKYRYRYAGTAPPVDGLLTVTAGPGAGRQTDKVDAGDGSEQTVVDWSPGARTTVSAGTGAAAMCTWSPGLLSLKLPLGTGSAWRADSTCTEATSTVHRTEDATVEGVTRTTIAGQTVDVWVISRHSITEVGATPSTRAVVEAQSSELFAPSLGLVVYQVTRTATPQADGTTATTTQTAELLDARPL